MRWPFRRKAAEETAPRSLRRSFVTPEGIDLQLDLGTAGARAVAFMLDASIILAVLTLATIAAGLLLSGKDSLNIIAILWLIGFFVLRNGWFILFEVGGRGATPGKRLMGLRVVARDGAPLTGGAVIARNAMREIEVFLPLSFLGYQAAQSAADGFLVLFALAWSGLFLFFPILNRDRLRIGDLVGGTWVVQTVRADFAGDIADRLTIARPRRIFSEAALDLYGIYELQTLEGVLRGGRADAIATVADAVRRKALLPDDGDDLAFLTDYYRALCARLERNMMLGKRRADKNDRRRA